MKTTVPLAILTLSLLLQVNAYDETEDDEYCSKLIRKFTNNCTTLTSTINNCCDLRKFPVSGVYKMSRGTFDKSARVYCDMVTDGGGWTVIQRNRQYSKLSFNRNWIDFEKGFGDLSADFWYGLEQIHCLTHRGLWEMRVDYQNKDRVWSYFHYTNFSVGDANEGYPLTVGGFTGIGDDYFMTQNDMEFSTPDNDNDKYLYINCASTYKSGWWYNACFKINLNRQPPKVNAVDMYFSEIKIRPKNCISYSF